MISFKRVYSKVKSPVYIKMFYLVLVAYIISLMQVNLTGGGEQFLLQQAERPDFINQTIPDFPDIRCGIRRLTQVPDTQWEFWQVRR